MLAFDCDAISQMDIVPDVAPSFVESKTFSGQPAYMGSFPRRTRVSSSSQTAMDPTIDLMTAPRWMDSANDSIRKFSLLEDNWDGYGSPPITDRSRRASLQVLSSVKIPTPPVIGPLPRGGLQLTFVGRDAELEFHVGPNGDVEYLLESMANGFSEEGVISATDTVGIASLGVHITR